MTIGGMIFMAVSWVTILGLVTYTLSKTFNSKK